MPFGRHRIARHEAAISGGCPSRRRRSVAWPLHVQSRSFGLPSLSSITKLMEDDCLYVLKHDREKQMARIISLLAALVVTITGVGADRAWADDGAHAVKSHPTATAAEALAPTPDAASKHEIDVGGQRIAYTATAGTLPLRDEEGKLTAHIFYTAYTAASASGPRPVTFVFNGGPGAASAFLHIGALGPRVIPFNAQGTAALHPVRLVDNDATWLQFTDLVFVDPVGTGYSRGVGSPEKIKERFFGVEKDADFDERRRTPLPDAHKSVARSPLPRR